MSEPRQAAATSIDELRHLHPPDEGDPEELAGDPMPDPWADDDQIDWPSELLDMGAEGGG